MLCKDSGKKDSFVSFQLFSLTLRGTSYNDVRAGDCDRFISALIMLSLILGRTSMSLSVAFCQHFQIQLRHLLRLNDFHYFRV